MINPEKLKQYRMSQTSKMPNLKDIIGKTVTPVDMKVSNYTAARDGSTHTVMAIDFGKDGTYRTEVASFIEQFVEYWDAFADEEEKPSITITGKTSRTGNPYVSFEVNA